MSAVETLTEARDLIARPGAWTQGAPARDADGKVVDFADEKAASWCITGVCRKVGVGLDEWLSLWNAAGGMPVAYWNDRPERTQAEIVGAFDRAIAFTKAMAA